MTTNLNRVDFDALVREARMERSLAIANAIAGVVAGAWRGIDRAVHAIARGSNRATHVGNPPAA